MRAYYNDTDAFCCAWLSNLMDAGHITPGKIDDRSITEVKPADLSGYERVHLFAGIAGWEVALELAGWGDGPVWTASCPCPPFSTAGRKAGCPECEGSDLVWCPRRTGFAICATCGHTWTADERHLWPEVWRLAAECRPRHLFGEQVASPSAFDWLAAVQASLEIIGYRSWAQDRPASSVGAPHARQRLWWVADTEHDCEIRRDTEEPGSGNEATGTRPSTEPGRCGDIGGLADTEGSQRRRRRATTSAWSGQEGGVVVSPVRIESADGSSDGRADGVVVLADTDSKQAVGKHRWSGSDQGREYLSAPGREPSDVRPGSRGEDGGMGDTDGGRQQSGEQATKTARHRDTPFPTSCVGQSVGAGLEGQSGHVGDRDQSGRVGAQARRSTAAASPWSDAEPIPCADGKSRLAEPGIFPLADGVPGRVGRLRAYGNAIVPQVAASFIADYMERDG